MLTALLIAVAVVLVGLGLTPLLGLGKVDSSAHFFKKENAAHLADLEAPLMLVADDSLTIQKVIELSFKGHNVRHVAAAKADDALAALQVRPFALAIVAYNLRLGDKLLATEIRNRHPKMPIILMPGTFEDYESSETKNLRFNAVIKKPFQSKDLVAKVERLAPKITKQRKPTTPK